MSGEKSCGFCVFMNPQNGYCRRHGDYVNALSLCDGFLSREESDELLGKNDDKR